MTTTEITNHTPARQFDTLSAGAAIYRRLERRPHRSKWLAAIPVAVIALFAIGGVLAYEAMNRSEPAAAVQTAPAPATALF